VYVFQGQTRVIVGVMVGAPNCDGGVNWVDYINDDVLGRIHDLMDGALNPSGMKSFTFSTPLHPPAVCGTSSDVLTF
jgi:hypothetical protein